MSKLGERKNRYSKLLESDPSKGPEFDVLTVAQRLRAQRLKRFKPTPEAGVFALEDLEALERTWESRRNLERFKETQDLKPRPKQARETLSNTPRYRQVAGDSTIHYSKPKK